MTKADSDFQGLSVASLESRRADDMLRMIQRFGGVPHVSPSMREVPIEPNRPAIDFAYQLMTGEIGTVIMMTGVGFRYLMRTLERHVDQQRFLDALSDVTTVCRGPKPAAAMREFGVTTTHRAPEPNTWRDVLTTIDANVSIANQVVGVQEYGVSNASLVAGLEARGATVRPLKVYGWEFPEDTQPLEQNVRRIAAGECDVVLVTSAHQVVNMLRMAEQLNMVDDLRNGLRETMVASIGPTTSGMLQECDIHVDMEPSHPKMGHLVTEAAQRCRLLVAAKRKVPTPAKLISDSLPPQDLTSQDEPNTRKTVMSHPSDNSLFIRACRGEQTERTPIWLMRQAGRYMSEYREVRAKQSFLELCANPQLCSEVMCTAVERLDVDAAIIFSDLLPILVPMGFDLEFVAGDGPVIHNPIREAKQIDQVKRLENPDELSFVYETVRQTRKDLPDGIPLIGFAGSPFTLASYAIEGGGSRTYTNTKKLMHSDGGAWNALMEKLSHAIVVYLNEQIAAGAQCVQLFDSWVGCLSPADYTEFVLPWMKQIIASITPGVPLINFGTGNPELLPLYRGDDRTVVGVDWRIDLSDAWARIGHDVSVQGNLDPAVLLGEPETIRQRAAEVLKAADGRPGHIFNLGHGVMKETPVENVIALVEYVKELSAR